jgi:hypothetical protein
MSCPVTVTGQTDRRYEQVASLFAELDKKQLNSLLQVLAKRIIVPPDSEIIDYELCSLFRA